MEPVERHRRAALRRSSAGLSLVELMVGLVIALVISLIMFNVFIVAEGQRRTTASGSDAQQSGAIASYLLERNLRMGGSSLAPDGGAWGCALSATKTTGADAGTRLPLPGSLAAPFGSLGLSDLRLVPALIVNASGDATSAEDPDSPLPDALVVMGGTQPSIDTRLQMTADGTATSVQVLNSVGLKQNDLLLAIERDSAAPLAVTPTCRFVQATSVIVNDPTQPNDHQSADDSGRQIKLTSNSSFTPAAGLSGYTKDAVLANVGGSPIFRIFALGPSAADPADLRSYDLLDGGIRSLSDGVVNLQAIYGVADLPTNPAVSAWVAPVGDWGAARLMDGSATSAANISLIRAIRFGLITRSAITERAPRAGEEAASPADWAIFGEDATLTITGTRTPGERNYRYFQSDITVPLRNRVL